MSKRIYIPALLAIAACANATQIISSTTGLASPDQTLTFDEVVLPDSTALTNQYVAFGVTFTSLFYNGCPGCVTTPPDGAKPDIGNFANSDTTTFNASFSIDFAGPVSGAAFELASNGGPFTLTALLGSTVVDQISVTIDTTAMNGSSGWGFYGFTGETFDNIQLTANQALLIDNLQTTAAAPEPSTLVLGSGALVLLALSRKFRRTA